MNNDINDERKAKCKSELRSNPNAMSASMSVVKFDNVQGSARKVNHPVYTISPWIIVALASAG